MKILYVPLDERPCNYKYPLGIVGNCKEVEFICPPPNILSSKKTSADIEQLWEFVEVNIADCDYAVLSIDMLVYGGLLPSRIHSISENELLQRVGRIKSLKRLNKEIKIYAFDTIMRVPSYDSSEEEPDYYAEYGLRIFRLSWLKDKIERKMNDDKDVAEYSRLLNEVPKEYQEDYFSRRVKNFKVTHSVLELVSNKAIDFLVIPQDDSALYGVQCKEQQKHIKFIESLDISDKVYIYPGADELGCTLLSRAVNDYKKQTPSVFVRFSSANGPYIVPKYEDRPYLETIKWHILSSGCWMADTSSDADIVLMVNTPGKEMQEAPNQDLGFRENSTMRNLIEFCTAIKQYIDKGKNVLVLDAAYSNGSDKELINLLAKMGLMSKLMGYAGWNTHANSLGTVLCSGTIGFYYGQNIRFLALRILEDCGYQAIVRQKVINELPSEGLSYYDFKDKETWVIKRTLYGLVDFLIEYIEPNFTETIKLENVSFPWKRMFEVDLNIVIEE